jgi:hypothetical protein
MDKTPAPTTAGELATIAARLEALATGGGLAQHDAAAELWHAAGAVRRVAAQIAPSGEEVQRPIVPRAALAPWSPPGKEEVNVITCPFCGKQRRRRYVFMWSWHTCRGCGAKAEWSGAAWHWRDTRRDKEEHHGSTDQ